MRATPVLIATIKPSVRQETPRNPAKTGAHQGDGARLVVEVVMAADSTRGGGPILAERRSVPGGDEAAVSGAGRSYWCVVSGTVREADQALDGIGAFIHLRDERNPDITPPRVDSVRLAREIAARQNRDGLLGVQAPRELGVVSGNLGPEVKRCVGPCHRVHGGNPGPERIDLGC